MVASKTFKKMSKELFFIIGIGLSSSKNDPWFVCYIMKTYNNFMQKKKQCSEISNSNMLYQDISCQVLMMTRNLVRYVSRSNFWIEHQVTPWTTVALTSSSTANSFYSRICSLFLTISSGPVRHFYLHSCSLSPSPSIVFESAVQMPSISLVSVKRRPTRFTLATPVQALTQSSRWTALPSSCGPAPTRLQVLVRKRCWKPTTSQAWGCGTRRRNS